VLLEVLYNIYIYLFRQEGSTNDKTIKSHTTTVLKKLKAHIHKHAPNMSRQLQYKTSTQAHLRNTETLNIHGLTWYTSIMFLYTAVNDVALWNFCMTLH